MPHTDFLNSLQATVTRRKTACTAGCSHSIMRHVISARRVEGFWSVGLVLPPFMQSVLACPALHQDRSGVVVFVRILDILEDEQAEQ